MHNLLDYTTFKIKCFTFNFFCLSFLSVLRIDKIMNYDKNDIPL